LGTAVRIRPFQPLYIGMRRLELVLVFIIGVIMISSMSYIRISTVQKSEINLSSGDTIVTVTPKIGLDTIIDVKGKKSLFIGDSQTSGYGWGWQDILCKKTGMTLLNTAVSGKRTDWMIKQLNIHKNKGFDYCFIYGGANDCAASISPETTFKNIQKMVDTCISHDMIPVVITGTDPNITFTGKSPEWKDYVRKKTKFQNYLVNTLQRATVVDTRFIPRSDCADFVCHMKISGHRKTANAVIKEMKFKTID